MTQEKNSEKKGLLQFFIVIAFIIAAIIFSQLQNGNDEIVKSVGSSDNSLLVETVKISPQEIPLEFQTTGTVRVRNTVEAVPQVSGRVVWVNSDFREGGTFKSNETLFRIEKEDFQLVADQAKAQIKQAETSLALEDAQGKAAMQEWEILNPGVPTPDLVARKLQLKQMQAELQSAKAVLRAAQLELNRTGYRLPYDGRVISSTIEVGQFIQAGQSYGQVYSRDALEVTVPISDDKLRWFNTKKAKAIFNTIYQGEEIEVKGKISRISNVLDNETRFANIIVTPNSSDWSSIIPGVFVDVKLEAQKMKGLWKIPNEAIQENKIVWVIDSERKIKQLSPEIIFTNKDYTIAKSNGSHIEIIASNIEGASDGMKIRVAGEE